MEQSSVLGFSWEFLDEMTVWTVGLALAIAVGVGFALRSVSFAIGCLVAVAVDVALVRTATHRARTELAEGRIDAVAPILMLAGRLLAKALLLTLSIFVPGVLGFSGTVAGALAFDITLVVVGSVVAASRMRQSKEGR